MNLPSRNYPTPTEVAAATTLATLGALPLGTPPDDVMAAEPNAALLYALGALGGAAVGGGLVGFVAAGDLRGAAAGSLLTMGLAGLADGFALVRRTDHKVVGVGLGVLGVLSVAAALYTGGRRP